MRALWLFPIAPALIACGMAFEDGAAPDADGDADADGDEGADAGPELDGAAGDADSDGDGDADSDGDGDGDSGPENSEQRCSDGWDNDDNGIADCWEPGCALTSACCEDVPTPLLYDDFEAGLDAELWKPFGSPAPSVTASIFYPSGDGAYESGIVSNGDPVHLEGELSIGVTIRLPADCDGCQELIGVAFTTLSEYTATATVEPVAGAVIDVASRTILPVVQGTVEGAPIAVPDEDVLELSIVIRPDRRVMLVDLQANGTIFTSAESLDPSSSDFFVAVFGRGGQAAGVDDIDLSSRICSDPSSGLRDPEPVVSADQAPLVASAVRSPSVTVGPEGGLEMLFTAATLSGSAIARATSDDGGSTWAWDRPDSPAIGDDDLPLGFDDADDPALVLWPDTARFAAVSAAREDGTRAIATFTSADGGVWDAAPGQQPLDLGGVEECDSVRDPALAVDRSGGLELVFTCEAPDGTTSIGRATSPDALLWTVQPDPILEGEGETELDGVAAPALLIDPGSDVHELWYEARDGVRRSIRYAVSAWGDPWLRWDGEVLGPGAQGAWDDLAVGDPSVTSTPEGTLELFYTGLGDSGQAIGQVTRRLPIVP